MSAKVWEGLGREPQDDHKDDSHLAIKPKPVSAKGNVFFDTSIRVQFVSEAITLSESASKHLREHLSGK